MCRLQISVTVQPTDFRRWFSCVPQLEPVEWLASMKLLAQQLGVTLLALLVGGCHSMPASPVAPSTTVPAAPTQTTAQPPAGAPFSIAISANGGSTFTDTQWQTSVNVSGRTTPARVTVNCNNGAPLQEYAGFSGSMMIACAFPTVGDYPVVVTALNAGFATSDRTTVTASERPALPPAAPVTLSLSAVRGNGDGHTFAEWKFSTSSSAPLAQCSWDFGDDYGATGSCSQGHIYYRVVKGEDRRTHTYTIRVFATRADGKSELSATRDIVVQFEP